jgi:cysteine synthase
MLVAVAAAAARGTFAVAAAAATFGAIHATASKLRSRLRALRIVAVATAAAPSGFIHAKASESGHLKRSFSSPPVASAY